MSRPPTSKQLAEIYEAATVRWFASALRRRLKDRDRSTWKDRFCARAVTLIPRWKAPKKPPFIRASQTDLDAFDAWQSANIRRFKPCLVADKNGPADSPEYLTWLADVQASDNPARRARELHAQQAIADEIEADAPVTVAKCHDVQARVFKRLYGGKLHET